MRALKRGRLVLEADPERGSRLVDEVYGFIGQEPVGNIAAAELHCGDERIVGDMHTMEKLVFFLKAAEDRNRVLKRRLRDVDRLEAPLEGRIALDVPLVLAQRGRADEAHVAARQRRLQHIRSVDGAFGRSGAYHGVYLVHEKNYLAVGAFYLLHDGLEALLELAAILGAGDERTHVERDQVLIPKRVRHVADGNSRSETFRDGGLAHAGLADQNGIVLGAARKDLDNALYLVVASDDRIELILERHLCERTGVLRERAELLLGRRRRFG